MLPINSAIFKAYDIRGVYGQDFDNELAYLLGLAFVALRQKDSDYSPAKKLTIAVGADMRLSSPVLKENLVRGLTAAGADVIDIGLVSTPTFYFAVGHYNYDGGVMVSASHNPKEWNGFKLVRSKGIPVSGDTGMEFLKEKILENHFLPAATPGQILKNNEVLREEIAYALSTTDLTRIKPLKVIVDTANGMGATYIQELFKNLPTKLVGLNLKLDGSFPAHEADPLKEINLQQVQQAVIKQEADLGISTDGDGDRVFFIDNQGVTIPPAIIRGLLAQLFLIDQPGAKIGYDVRPGKITVDMIKEAGGIPTIARVGHSLIKEQMLKENIYFAAESSGHFFLNGPNGCFEYPSIMILKLLTAFSAINSSIADYVRPYKKYFASGEINSAVKDKEVVFQKILKRYADGKINQLDGVSVEYPDYWFNVRGSNTEPIIRLNLEAISSKIMEQKRDEVLNLIKE